MPHKQIKCSCGKIFFSQVIKNKIHQDGKVQVVEVVEHEKCLRCRLNEQKDARRQAGKDKGHGKEIILRPTMNKGQPQPQPKAPAQSVQTIKPQEEGGEHITVIPEQDMQNFLQGQVRTKLWNDFPFMPIKLECGCEFAQLVGTTSIRKTKNCNSPACVFIPAHLRDLVKRKFAEKLQAEIQARQEELKKLGKLPKPEDMKDKPIKAEDKVVGKIVEATKE